MKPYFLDHLGNPSSTHQHGRVLRTAIEQSRRVIASALHAHPHEIVFTSGGTEADNIAIRGAVGSLGVQHVVSTPLEHHAVTHTLEALEASGKIRVSWLSVDQEGAIALEELRELLRKLPHSLVSLMHANNELGNIYDLSQIAELCKAEGAYLHSDTVQTMGNLSYDLRSCPVDFLAASAHKFYGPKGIGALYVRRAPRVTLCEQMHGGGHERGMRSGTLPTHQIVGMGEAAAIVADCMAEEERRLLALRERFLDGALALPGVQLNGDRQQRLAGVVNLAFADVDGETLIMALNRLALSTGSACTSASLEPSYVLSAMGLPDELAHSSLRFSFGRYTTDGDIDFAVAELGGTLARLRTPAASGRPG